MGEEIYVNSRFEDIPGVYCETQNSEKSCFSYSYDPVAAYMYIYLMYLTPYIFVVCLGIALISFQKLREHSPKKMKWMVLGITAGIMMIFMGILLYIRNTY